MPVVELNRLRPQPSPQPLVIKFKGHKTLADILRSTETCERLIRGAMAEEAAERAYGKKLRTSATICFQFGHRKHYVRAKPVVYSSDRKHEYPDPAECWTEVGQRALTILQRIAQYAHAAKAISAIERQVAGGNFGALEALPELPTQYTRSYIATVFGSRYAVVRDRLVDAARQAKELDELERQIEARKAEATAAITEASEVTAAIAEDKDATAAIAEASEVSGAVVDDTTEVLTPEDVNISA